MTVLMLPEFTKAEVKYMSDNLERVPLFKRFYPMVKAYKAGKVFVNTSRKFHILWDIKHRLRTTLEALNKANEKQ